MKSTTPPHSPKGEVSHHERGTPLGEKEGAVGMQGMHHGASGQLFSNARELRNRETPAEKELWKYLRKNNLGVKFRRQHPMGSYIADFYCHKVKFVIELDGEYHDNKEQQVYDSNRDKEMTSLGIKVLRFSNHSVIKNIEEVLMIIKREIS